MVCPRREMPQPGDFQCKRTSSSKEFWIPDPQMRSEVWNKTQIWKAWSRTSTTTKRTLSEKMRSWACLFRDIFVAYYQTPGAAAQRDQGTWSCWKPWCQSPPFGNPAAKTGWGNPSHGGWDHFLATAVAYPHFGKSFISTGNTKIKDKQPLGIGKPP